MSGLISFNIESDDFSPFCSFVVQVNELCRNRQFLRIPNSLHFQFTFALSDGWVFLNQRSGSTELTLNIKLDSNENWSRAYFYWYSFLRVGYFRKVAIEKFIRWPPSQVAPFQLSITIAPSSKVKHKSWIVFFTRQISFFKKFQRSTRVVPTDVRRFMYKNVWHFWTERFYLFFLRRLFFNLALCWVSPFVNHCWFGVYRTKIDGVGGDGDRVTDAQHFHNVLSRRCLSINTGKSCTKGQQFWYNVPFERDFLETCQYLQVRVELNQFSWKE